MLRNIDDPQPLRMKLGANSDGGHGSDQEDMFKEMSFSEQQLILEAAFTAVCDNIMSSQMHGNTDMWLQLSVDDKLLQFASFLSHMRKDYRLGAIVGVYIIFKNNFGNNGQNLRRSSVSNGDINDRMFTNITTGGVLSNYNQGHPEIGVYNESQMEGQ